MQLYTYDTHMFALFTKTLPLFLLPLVQEVRREIRRSSSHSNKTKHFNVARKNIFNVAKTELFNVAKTEFFKVANGEVFNISISGDFNIA